MLRGVHLAVEFQHKDDTPLVNFFQRFPGNPDFSTPLKILSSHWVENVADLRLVTQEGQLRLLSLPLRLCSWIEEEIWKTTEPQIVAAAQPRPANQELHELNFTQDFDFDENGIIFFLGTRGRTQPWLNPMQLGFIEVTTSGLGKDSQPPFAVVGREAVRCLTAPQENAWFLIDFKEHRINPTCYTLRHYVSWDTECLRHWRLEASNDMVSWTLLRVHENDEGLQGKGSTHTWDVQSPSFFRAFRITMTGLNSNKHNYMALSGFEVYGKLRTPFAPSEEMKQRAPAANADVPSQGPNVFRYVSDFDQNGIMYNLGTWKGSRPWQNAANLDLVRITSSSLMADSTPESALLGPDVVRCVTKPVPKSWFCFDLINKMAQVTHYSLRHYSSWDMEALRSWIFEGSMDGQAWETIMEHKNDTSLNARGATSTWAIPPARSRTPYRFFRIFQTGENSNRHHYLALSGFEIYGALLNLDGTPFVFDKEHPPVAPSPVVEWVSPKVFHYGSDLDDQGVVYWLGTNKGTAPWRNPVSLSALKISASSVAADSEPLSAVVGREVVRCVTKPEPMSWICVDLVDKVLRPSHYTLRHYATWDTEALRYWNFEGSLDGVAWDLLSHHEDDVSLNAKGATFTWEIKSQTSYRMFRVLQTGPNSNKHHYLALSGFELYGVLSRVGDPEPPADILPVESPAVVRASTSKGPQQGPAPVAGGGAAGAAGGAQAQEGKNEIIAHENLTWDPDVKNKALQVIKGDQVKNTGSNDKWQMIRTAQTFNGGRHLIGVRITVDPKTTNTWRFIIGAIPANYDYAGKQWVGANGSWGYIAGTGGKCSDQPKTVPYGAKFEINDIVGILLDFEAKTIEFFRNGVGQGVAFTNLTGPVHIAASLTATDSCLALCAPTVPVGAPGPAIAAPEAAWDANNKSPFMQVTKPDTVMNTGSNDKWQSIRATRLFRPELGVQSFEIEFVQCPRTPNSWQVIVGVVPAAFTCNGPKQWVGASGSWGYIGGTGGICHEDPRSVNYGEPFGKTGDVIRCVVDYPKRCIEFWKNGSTQGVAFRNVDIPVYPAVSLTAAGATARLVFKD